MKILFGRHSGWQNHLPALLDQRLYNAEYVDFTTADLAQADYAVPLSLEDISHLRARYGDRSRQFLIPDAKVMALCADKKIFNETILASRFASLIPPIYPPRAGLFPYVLKRRDQLSGVEIFVVRGPADEARNAKKLVTGKYYCQEYVPGLTEYATHLLLKDGKVIYHCSHRYTMGQEFTIMGNEQKPVRVEACVDVGEDVLAALAGVMEILNFNGPCCLDYKLQNGKPRLLEANPRCGNSLFRDINRFLAVYISALSEQAQNGRV